MHESEAKLRQDPAASGSRGLFPLYEQVLRVRPVQAKLIGRVPDLRLERRAVVCVQTQIGLFEMKDDIELVLEPFQDGDRQTLDLDRSRGLLGAANAFP